MRLMYMLLGWVSLYCAYTGFHPMGCRYRYPVYGILFVIYSALSSISFLGA